MKLPCEYTRTQRMEIMVIYSVAPSGDSYAHVAKRIVNTDQ